MCRIGMGLLLGTQVTDSARDKVPTVYSTKTGNLSPHWT